MSMRFHRVDYPKHIPDAFRGLYATSTAVHDGALGKEFLELVFLRVSQINGCAYCMDMHAGALRKAGVEPRKLDTLAGWRDSRFFDRRDERASPDEACRRVAVKGIQSENEQTLTPLSVG